MRLRTRLLVFSSAQQLAFGVLVAIGYGTVERTAFPMLVETLMQRTETTTIALGSELDVGLATADRAIMAEAVADLTHDPDLRSVEVRSVDGAVVYRYGATLRETSRGPAQVGREDGDTLRAWAPVSLEGVPLGSVTVAFSTERIDALRTWIRLLIVIIGVVWLLAIAYSLRFARAFVAPIGAMKEFSKKVADGNLSEQLEVITSGELLELADYLNAMTRDLQAREQERQANAERTDEMQQQLLVMSRMAGMAEVATGVLHNVGNVLNSLNVSVSLVGDHVRNSKASALVRTVELYKNYPGGLAALLSTEKGKLVPQFLASVSERLLHENAQVQRELASVTQNVDHIKAIVATQQAYANVSGIREVISLPLIVDEALAMSERSFSRHKIELVRDYESGMPAISSDRHRVLQILVNLISNARHALEDAPRLRLTVRLRSSATGVTLSVVDTGIGISEENLARVFQHGFTTKQGGHGFGLHSSANAAVDLGGSLVAASDGEGCGATFTLELPREAPSTDHETTN